MGRSIRWSFLGWHVTSLAVVLTAFGVAFGGDTAGEVERFGNAAALRSLDTDQRRALRSRQAGEQQGRQAHPWQMSHESDFLGQS